MKIVMCKKCNGTGWVECPLCRGQGVIRELNKTIGGLEKVFSKECWLCRGSGAKICGVCEGKGEINRWW